jgi:hypothetical protein
VDSLQRIPLDRIDGRLVHSHRRDIIRLADYIDPGCDASCRVTGTVLPIDERPVTGTTILGDSMRAATADQ